MNQVHKNGLYSVTFVARMLGTSPASIHAYLAGQRRGNPRHVDFPAPAAIKLDDPDVPYVGTPLWDNAGLEAITAWYSRYLATMYTSQREADQNG